MNLCSSPPNGQPICQIAIGLVTTFRDLIEYYIDVPHGQESIIPIKGEDIKRDDAYS
jgi:hypothetical protein